MTAPMRLAPHKPTFEVATEEHIVTAIEWFAAAAARCVAAGFDAIELHAGHGYLIDWFLSPAKNTRTDAWGGDLAGRSRFLCEIIGAVRERVGPDIRCGCGSTPPNRTPRVARSSPTRWVPSRWQNVLASTPST